MHACNVVTVQFLKVVMYHTCVKWLPIIVIMFVVSCTLIIMYNIKLQKHNTVGKINNYDETKEI